MSHPADEGVCRSTLGGLTLVHPPVTSGEGDHSLHHRFPFDHRAGARWWQYDPSTWLIWALARTHAAGAVRTAAATSIERARTLARTGSPTST